MARRAFLPTIPPPSGPPPADRTREERANPRSQPPPPSTRSVPPPSTRGSVPPPATRTSVPPTGMNDGRMSSPPGLDGVPMPAVTQLLDRLAAADEAQFL